MKHFAILGIHPELSRAELATIMKKPLEIEGNEAAAFTSPIPLSQLQNLVGGTQKMGDIVKIPSEPGDLAKIIFSHLRTQASAKKLCFGISVYALGKDGVGRKQRESMYRVGLKVKRLLKDVGIRARLVTSRDQTLSTVVVSKNKLPQEGAEYVVLIRGNEMMLGQTRTVQNFEDWSRRDYERPGRDAKSGMLPPKLARMMVNLSGVEPNSSTLLDPFCGSGTILMEASLLGFHHVIGSDLSKRAIQDTKDNLVWLQEHGYQLVDHTVFQSNASHLPQQVDARSIDALITEPFLGTPRTGREHAQEIESQIEALAELYKKTFTAIDSVLKPESKIVIASPVHFIKDHIFHVPTVHILQALGYTQIHKPMLYRREGQFVGREILIFQKPS